MVCTRTARQLCLLVALLFLQLNMGQKAHAQGGCVTFSEARRLGLFAKLSLRPAAAVKSAVEARTGGKVVGFMICRPGPVYQLTVLHAGGRVETISEPAK